MQSLFFAQGEHTFAIFLVLDLLLGGAAAFAAGRALAKGWRSFWLAPASMLLLAAFVRFLHYALFAEPLFSLSLYATDYVSALVFATAGFRFTRSEQMKRQYGWMDTG